MPDKNLNALECDLLRTLILQNSKVITLYSLFVLTVKGTPVTLRTLNIDGKSVDTDRDYIKYS